MLTEKQAKAAREHFAVWRGGVWEDWHEQEIPFFAAHHAEEERLDPKDVEEALRTTAP